MNYTDNSVNQMMLSIICKPNDVVNHYLTGMDIDEISNKIVKSRWIKRILAGILIVIIVTSLTLVGIIYREYKVLESEQIYFEEEVIE